MAVCNGDGRCLEQDDHDLNSYYKKEEIECMYDCEPKLCPTNGCQNMQPQYIYDKFGVCTNCKFLSNF